MRKPAFLLAAPSSNSGKTTLTLALLRILVRKGLAAQPFKCGPDYLDTMLHSLAASSGGRGRRGRNLDAFMASERHMREVFLRNAEGADVLVAEGVMGLFDGAVKSQGSSAAIAKALGIPVVLVVDAKGTAYSVAPLLYGFKNFDPELQLAGVIFNRVNTFSHYEFLREASRDVGVESLGYVPRDEAMTLSERYLGLNISADADQESAIGAMADHVGKTVDVDRLLELSMVDIASSPPPAGSRKNGDVVIGVARDEAFNFVYAENLDILSRYGTIEWFSPLHDDSLPEADMLYFAGGYPELYAAGLEANVNMRCLVREFVEKQGLVYAECGGMMYLGNAMTGHEGTIYNMCGALDLETSMQNARLHLGYRKIDLSSIGYGRELKGHEFHYSRLERSGELANVAAVRSARDKTVDTAVFRFRNTFASYVHQYWGDTPDFPVFLLDRFRVSSRQPGDAAG
ncbi:cobyrinic acid a,c-diamide synthase [Prosthecochloris sp. GSB1]|uniref:cobyrinate a,c-diamide synthase n=1 Tax=Prosthecochloris sp. GSB1 TaxID=281093 RepID=UPI000B8CC7C2|nr:cobyrinate a,c-diamide synthase [Prosthecochloris sp. GSB1]ASQ90368.1 cobyrinic acid a,c-diamide synthase [Prosthecochloris sp. GSB1]